MRALQGGCDVITEKPLTIDAESCRRIFAARQASGRELDWQLWMLVSFEMWFRTFLDDRVVARTERESGAPSTTRAFARTR